MMLKNDLTKSVLGLIICGFIPFVVDDAMVSNLSYFMLWCFCAIGLAAMWGYAGILSFGQTAFFGISGYAYGILTINFGDGVASTWLGLVGSLVIAGIVALAVGYMIFYGNVSGVFVGIITLSITLVLETFVAQTAGPQWAIGEARLNGFNGMSGMPPLTLPWSDADGISVQATGTTLYYIVLILLCIAYFLTQKMLKSRFGLTLRSIKENPKRAEMLGIDIRKYQLLIFVFGGVMAGLSGSLYTIWGEYITPSTMGLTAAAMPVIWVAVSGKNNMFYVILATVLLGWISQSLAVYGSEYALILMGVLLLFVILVAPEGFFPWLVGSFKKITKGGK